MHLSLRVISVAFILSVGLSACVSSEPTTHAEMLPGNIGMALYHCGELEGAEATAALKKSHKLMTTKFNPMVEQHEAELDRLSKTPDLSQEAIVAANSKTRSLKQQIEAETAAAGCKFKGIALGEVVKP